MKKPLCCPLVWTVKWQFSKKVVKSNHTFLTLSPLDNRQEFVRIQSAKNDKFKHTRDWQSSCRVGCFLCSGHLRHKVSSSPESYHFGQRIHVPSDKKGHNLRYQKGVSILLEMLIPGYLRVVKNLVLKYPEEVILVFWTVYWRALFHQKAKCVLNPSLHCPGDQKIPSVYMYLHIKFFTP